MSVVLLIIFSHRMFFFFLVAGSVCQTLLDYKKLTTCMVMFWMIERVRVVRFIDNRLMVELWV